MATRTETLRTETLRTHVGTARNRELIAKFAAAFKEWGRKGQLGSASSEMRGYTGAR